MPSSFLMTKLKNGITYQNKLNMECFQFVRVSITIKADFYPKVVLLYYTFFCFFLILIDLSVLKYNMLCCLLDSLEAMNA